MSDHTRPRPDRAARCTRCNVEGEHSTASAIANIDHPCIRSEWSACAVAATGTRRRTALPSISAVAALHSRSYWRRASRHFQHRHFQLVYRARLPCSPRSTAVERARRRYVEPFLRIRSTRTAASALVPAVTNQERYDNEQAQFEPHSKC